MVNANNASTPLDSLCFPRLSSVALAKEEAFAAGESREAAQLTRGKHFMRPEQHRILLFALNLSRLS